MNNRLLLHDKLKELFGIDNVYYQPPNSTMIKYPCIIYKLNNVKVDYANNIIYKHLNNYDITFIYKKPADNIIDEMFKNFNMCSLSRVYVSDNLNHYAFSLYY